MTLHPLRVGAPHTECRACPNYAFVPEGNFSVRFGYIPTGRCPWRPAGQFRVRIQINVHAPVVMRPLFTLSLILLALLTGAAHAQWRSGAMTIYPEKLYPGENVITVSSSKGIDKVRYRASRNAVVTVPASSPCATSIDIRVRVADPTTNESVDFTIYDCSGDFVTHTLPSENWTIRKEYTGRVEVGRDTCLLCEISTTEPKFVDSIVINDPRFTVRMPGGTRPWRAIGDDFHYTICYRPSGPETVNEKIRLYMRRGQPNGGLTTYTIDKPISAVGVDPPHRGL